MDVLSVLQRLGSGRLLDDLGEALAATSREVVATGKPGTVTITLRLSTRSQGDPFITVDEALSRSVPKRAPRGAAFYAIDGELYRNDPRQERMEFKVVSEAPSDVREVEPREKVERKIV